MPFFELSILHTIDCEVTLVVDENGQNPVAVLAYGQGGHSRPYQHFCFMLTKFV